MGKSDKTAGERDKTTRERDKTNPERDKLTSENDKNKKTPKVISLGIPYNYSPKSISSSFIFTASYTNIAAIAYGNTMREPSSAGSKPFNNFNEIYV
ncbi:hypothetical protein SAMN05518872_103299 [Psychrobacillus sp. OK032]|nr:hypothetical protein SAMN05518872_103299 [Psychrobacillus sp. OK032]